MDKATLPTFYGKNFLFINISSFPSSTSLATRSLHEFHKRIQEIYISNYKQQSALSQAIARRFARVIFTCLQRTHQRVSFCSVLISDSYVYRLYSIKKRQRALKFITRVDQYISTGKSFVSLTILNMNQKFRYRPLNIQIKSRR